jgi:hypothetical protein
MPTYLPLPDPAESGESDHIADHNAIVDAVSELQTYDGTHVVTVTAGNNVTVSRVGQAVTVNSDVSSAHTHSTLESVDADLQTQIDDIGTTLLNPLSIEIAPAGSSFYVDKVREGGTWPARPTARTDITVIWKGDTDPSQEDPNPVGTYDIWFQTTG